MKKMKNLLIGFAILAAFETRASADLTISTQIISGATVYITQEMNWGEYKPAITRDIAGNLYVVNSFSTSGSDPDIVIRKFDSSFNPLWMQISSSPANGYDYGKSITVDTSGNNVYVVGSHDRSDLSQGQNIWIARYNASNGAFISSRTYNGAPSYSNDAAYDIVLDGSGNVYVVGSMYFDYSGYINTDVWLSKFDSNLNQVWVTTYNSVSNNYDYGYAITVKDTFIYVAGSVNDINYGNEIWFAKYKTSDGSKEWEKTYYNGILYAYDYGYDIKVDGIGNIYVTGSESRSDLSQGDNIYLGKFDAYGNMMWNKSYNGPSNGWDYGYGLFIDNTDNVYLAGKIDTSDQGSNFRLYKYNPNGNLLYLKDINSTESTYSTDTAYDVFVSSTGHVVYVAGTFNNKFGICTYQETEGGTTGTATLSAGPGSYTASVNLSWSYTTGLPSNSTYYIQYTTSANTVWNISSAQIVVPTGPVSIGFVQNHVVGGLEASRDGYGNLTSPNYYFKVWISSPGNVGALPGPATSYAKTPDFDTQTSVYADGKMFLVNALGITVKSAFARDSSGNNYVALGSLPTGTGDSGWTLYKYDSSGSIIWTKFYNSPVNANYNIYRIKTDNAGNIYLAGSQSAGTFSKIWSCKLNPDGKVLWEKIFNNPENAQDEGRGVAVDASGNVYVAGYFWGGAGIGFNIWLGKYNPGGLLLGATNYTSSIIGSDYAYDVKADTSGYVYVSGSEAATITNRDALIIKYDASGSTPTLVGKIAYNSALDNTDEFNGLTLDNSGNVYAAGYEYRMDLTQGRNVLLGKYDSNLTTLLSTKTYNSSTNSDEEGYSVTADASGNIYVAGYETRSDLFQYKNFWARKYDSAGNVKWTKTHNGSDSLDDFATSGIYLDNADNVYAGIMENSSVGFYKFSQPSFAITAGPGKPGTSKVSWISESELATGTTFYVQHSTYSSGVSWLSSNAQDVFYSEWSIPSGGKIEYFIGGLDVGRDSAGNDNSPAYYFRVWTEVSGTTTPITGTATGYANVPSVTDSSYIYPNAKLFAMNNVYGQKNPITKDSSGNIYIAGTVWIQGDDNTAGMGGNSISVIRKYNSTGGIVWTKFYSDGKDSSYPEVGGLTVDAQGNLYVIGTHGTWESSTKQDIFVLKYNSSGKLLWKRSYDNVKGNDYGRGIALDSSGYIYITGSVDVGGYNQDIFVAKLSSSGVVQSSITVNGSANSSDEGYAIAIDTSSTPNMLYVAGRLYEIGTGSNFWLGKAEINVSSFTPVWSQTVTGDVSNTWDTAGYSAAVDASGNVYAAGTLTTANEGTNIYVVKYSSGGAELWKSEYNSSSQNWDEGFGVALDGFGGVYVSGKESRWDINQGDNIFIRKYNTTGDVLWTHTFNSAGSNYDAGFGVVADNYGFVYVAANTGNGTGFYRYQQKSTNVVNPGLTVRVNRKFSDGSSVPLQHVNVVVMAFTETGGIDANTIRMGTTNVNGVYNCFLPAGMQYFIALSTPNMTPTVKDQMMDPYGSFFVELNADATKQYYLYPRSALNPAYTLTLNITSGIVTGDYLTGEVYINKTGEKTAYGMTRATDTAGVLEIYNLPSAVKGTYGVVVTIPGKNKSYQLFMNSDFRAVSSYSVDMASAMVFTGGFDASASTSPPSFQGVVRSTIGAPLEGTRIELKQWQCNGMSCYETARYDTKTDTSGKFMFYNIPTSTDNYRVTVTKLGYKNQYEEILISTGNITTMVKEYQLEVATYTLTGILKYNGVPIPNADIMLGPDWNSYWNGNDSYTGWGKWMQNDIRTETNADGTFSARGLVDGNVRITASFKGGWKELNKGNNENMDSDDIRVVISSQGATGPQNPLGNPCKPGSAWILNSSGTCVSAGIVNFNIIPENTNTFGKLHGDIVFVTTYPITSSAPLVISTSSPVTIMAVEDCNDCQNRRMGFASVSGILTNNSISYSLNLSSGTNYWVLLVSNEWGNISLFGSDADFRSTDTVKFDFKVTKSGALKGTVKMPDGSDFRPKWGGEEDPDSYWADIQVDGVNVQVNDGTGLNEFGEFEFPNLAPGIYNVKLQPKGKGFRWPPAMLEGVSVAAGKTSEIKLQIENGLKVQPQIYGLPEISTPTWTYGIIGVNSGEEMNYETITDLFFEDPKYFFEYSTSTGWSSLWMSPGQYDFYLILGSKYQYEPGGSQDEPNSYHQFANFMGRVKGMAIQKDEQNPNLGSENQPVQLNILGSIGQTLISGTVKGNKIFVDSDYERMFANFQEVIPIIPAVMIYDSAGDLKGFSNAMPDEQAIIGFFNGIFEQDKEIIKSTFAARPLRYLVWGLPPGRYTAVFINPNYPPITKEITLPANETYNFDFDLQNILVGSIQGVVKTSGTLENIENAKVYLKHRIVEKFAVTNSSGEFQFSDLPPGIYRLEITKDGFVTVGQKTSLSGDKNSSFVFYMTPSDSKITGKVYTSKFPNSVTKAGIKIVAYDETFNVQYPSAYLSKTEVQTNDRGEYEIPSVIPGHVYKISAFYSGKLPEIIEATAVNGTSMAGDIILKDIPPQITIKVKKSPDSANKVDVTIKSPKTLISIPTCKYNPGQEFDPDSAVSLALVPGTGNTYLGQFTVTSGQQYYAIKVSAGNAGSQMEKNFVYDQVSNAKTEQFMQDEAIAGGEVQMDKEQEEYTGLELDAGAISYSSGTVDYSDLVGGFFSALPSIRTVKTNKGSLSLESAITSLMASEVYNLDFSNSQPNKPFTLTIKYDKEKAINTNALRIYQYDSESGTWKEVPGNYTVDPMLGIVSVEVASIQNAYTGTGDVTTPLGRKRLGMSAIKNGRYVPSNGSSSQSGQFAVFTAKPGTGIAYTGSSFEIYNMPNPFNLKSKTVVISADGGSAITPGNYSTNGTIIKYHLPSGKTGNVKLVLYNIAGEKVRTLDEGARTGGQIYYSEWDGKNDKNQNCASGVYFLMTFLNGDKLGNKAHKMAIIK